MMISLNEVWWSSFRECMSEERFKEREKREYEGCGRYADRCLEEYGKRFVKVKKGVEVDGDESSEQQ